MSIIETNMCDECGEIKKRYDRKDGWLRIFSETGAQVIISKQTKKNSIQKKQNNWDFCSKKCLVQWITRQRA